MFTDREINFLLNSWYEFFRQVFIVWGALVTGVSLGFASAAYMYKYYVIQERRACGYDDDLESGTSSDRDDADDLDADEDLDGDYACKQEALEKEAELKVYKELYYEELAALTDRDLTDIPWTKLVLKEMTPQGLVIMFYDPLSERFCYYADEYQKVSYSVLDTLARKFAIHFDCKRICVNYREELLLAKAKQEDAILKEKEKEKKEMDEPVVKSVFATFKKYNTGPVNKKKVHADDDEEDQKDHDILPENANCFKYKGKVKEYYQEPLVVVPKKTIDYATFKLLQQAAHLKVE